MKKDTWLCLAVAVLLAFGTIGIMPTDTKAEGQTYVTLTETQQKEIAALQKEVLEQRKAIINKYVEYGVFTAEKGNKIIAHLEERYSKLEQNGFVPTWDKDHRKPEHKNE